MVAQSNSLRLKDLGALAEGGMATLSLATDEDGATVVVKRIRPELSWDEAYRHLFDDEGRVLSLLDHPNIVAVRARGCDDAGAFLVLEHVDGSDLGRVLDAAFSSGTPVELAAVLAVAIPLAEALDFAHEARATDGTPLGIVHRDISPGNVLLSVDGDVKLADFGVAKSAIKTDATVVGEMKGKFAYMAPEQSRGEDIDARADLFALGIVLHEMLTARKLFDGPSDADVVHAVRTLVAPRTDAVNTTVPVALADLVARLLEKDRSARPTRARDVVTALREITCECCLDQGLRRHVSRLARQHPRPAVAPVVVDDARRKTQRVIGAPVSGRGPKQVRSVVLATSGSIALGLAALVATGSLGAGRGGSALAVDARTADDGVVDDSDVVDGVVDTDEDTPSPVVLPVLRVAARPGELTTATAPPPTTVGPDPRARREREAGVRLARSTPRDEGSPKEQARAAVPVEGARAESNPRTAVPTTEGLRAAGYGKLYLRSEPWATVTIDGVATGQTTPLNGLVLASGKHTIELTNPHYGLTRVIDVVVPSGGDVKHSLRLDER
jgi:hypothetical protein